MKHIRTRLFGITLSFIMLISLLPVTALAGEAAWNGTTVDTSWYDDNTTDTDEFTISDSADLAGLAELVNEGNNFSGKTIKLGDDIDLGGKDVTADNNVAKIDDQGYTTLAAAIEAANRAADDSNVTVTITKSGEYDPFTINRANVTVQAAEGVEATITVSSTVNNQFNASNITLKNLNFISKNGATIISFGECDNLTLENCIFTGDGTGTALFTHQPNITIRDCVFKDFAYAYDTCGDNHAAGKITITGNTFDNIRVPINGYWGKTATTTTNIQITDNTIAPGSWGTSYLQLWDYAQYLKWLKGNQLESDRQGSAIKATIQNNTYEGDVVIYATHFNWFYDSGLNVDDASKALLKYRVLVELDGADSATVTNKDGSAITAFNESTGADPKGDKYVIYSLSEGEYKVNVTQKQEDGDSVVTEYDLTVVPTKPDLTGGNTQKIKVTPLDGENNTVAVVDNVPYTSLAAAVEAAKNKNGGTVELQKDISIDTWNQVWNVKNMIIKGNNHTITIGKVESGVNGNYLFYGAEDLNVSDLTINFTTNGSGFSMVSGKLEGVTVNGGVYAVATGAAPDGQKVEIKNCTFTGQSEMAIYTQENGNAANTVIDGCTFNSERAVILRNNEQFTNNTVKGSAGVTIYSSATATVTGNTFTEGSRLKVYNTKSTIERNKLLGNVVLDDTVPIDSKVSLDKNYWGESRTPSLVLGNDASKVDGGKTEYYVRPTMRPSDLNTYVPPTTGGGSSSSGDYLITVDKTVGGKVTVNPGRADKGDTITITVKPNDGYELDQLSVTDKDGDSVKVTNKGNGKYTFTMPGSQITIKATFKAAESSALDNFTDVNSNAWYADAVEFVIEEGLMTGTSDTTFAPDTSMSRAMIWTVLAAYNGANTSGGNPWYAPSQQWAMINGVSDGSAPNGSITREQLAVMLWRAAGSPSTSKNLTGYADANAVSDWAVEALAWAVDNGIISGMSGSSLAPQNTATRAQVAVMLMQFVECMDA